MQNGERFFHFRPELTGKPFFWEERVVPERLYDQTMAPRARVRWAPIWAGLLTTFGLFLLLELAGCALGWLSLGMGATSYPRGSTQLEAWITGTIGMVSFFLGGWIAASTGSVKSADAGLINGFCLWGLSMVTILALSALGLGAFFGAAGNSFNQLLTFGRGVNFGAAGMDQNQIVAAVRDGALWAFITMTLSATSAMLGGLAGVRDGAIRGIRPID